MQILNLGVLAHVDAGKTTTVEQLLYLAGGLRAPGSVESGNTQTDWLEIERRRGISVRTASAVLHYREVQINLIDTPGHMDFTGEVERALAALDAVILVVSCAEGIQSQTERFWKALREKCIPTLILVNKVDRAGCEPERVAEELRHGLSSAVIPVQRVERPGSSACAVAPKRLDENALLELCALDDTLAERYLGGEQIAEVEWDEALALQTCSGRAFPLLFGCMAQNVGGKELLEAVVRYLPKAESRPEGEVSGIVYKLEHDKAMGKIAHVRLFTGALRNREAVELHRQGVEPFTEKVTQIRRVNGARQEDTGLLVGGDIAAVYGLSGARAGDAVGRMVERAGWGWTTPLLSVKVQPEAGMHSRMLAAIQELADEDPLLGYQWDAGERELSIRIMGEIQLEVLSGVLAERYGLAAGFSAPSVIYKETPAKRGIGREEYTMPKPCWAVLTLQIDPLPRGSGYQYESVIKDNQLFYRYQNHIERTVPEALQQGLLGWEVTDLKVTLTAGEHHTVHTHPLDFFLATPIAVMKALQDAGTILLEPVLRMRLSAPEELSGKLIGDIISMRGEFDSPVLKEGRVQLEAFVPAATSIGYAARFASVTGGRGAMSAELHHYQECPLELGATAKRRGVNPLDRDKWILHKRGAIG